MSEEIIYRQCMECCEEKPPSQFRLLGTLSGRLSERCRDCANTSPKKIKARQDKLIELEKQRGRWLNSKYGITLEEYEKIKVSQGGGCAICGIVPSPGGSGPYARLCVDHDHRTGKIRGLLCNGCNTAIGRLGDSAKSLHRAYVYLAEHEQSVWG